jgi:GMP synthase (glutamine-hydrolysing)
VRDFVLIRHGHDPEDDRVVAFARRAGFRAVTLRPFAGDALPGAPGAATAGTVVFGGPFAVFEEDRHPFLRDEARSIKACMARGRPVLGICRGAQQIARLCGARVGPLPGAPGEFGCYEIRPTPEAVAEGFLTAPIRVAQAHRHGFDLRAGAARLAGSALFPNQAFRLGARSHALQFRPEVTAGGFRRWQAVSWAPWQRPGVQPPAAQDAVLAAADLARGNGSTPTSRGSSGARPERGGAVRRAAVQERCKIRLRRGRRTG